jgi:uncharacterized membrane protein HdeD (DUF308 family)
VNIARANRIFRWGSVIVILLGLILGARATAAALVLVVTFLIIFLICDGIRLCIYELRGGEKISAFLVATSYLAGCFVLLMGLRTLLGHVSDRLNQKFSQLFALSLLMLLFVFFVGLLREGSSALSENFRKGRYALATFNLAVLVGMGIVVLIGARQIAAKFFE